jgi:hypothetical protein
MIFLKFDKYLTPGIEIKMFIICTPSDQDQDQFTGAMTLQTINGTRMAPKPSIKLNFGWFRLEAKSPEIISISGL